MNRTYTVGHVARLVGVTVRTLHHYDEIGLLPPSGRAANGYRTYTDVDVARLQRILSWRELGFDLEQVASLVATDGTAEAVARQLDEQHAQLRQRIDRLQSIADIIAKTREAHRMGISLTPDEMLEVFGREDPAQHAAEAEHRWGDTEAWAESHRRTARYGKQDWLDIRREMEQVEERFATAMSAGLPADADEAAAAARAHRDHISARFYELTDEAHRGVAELYVTEPRFQAHYDARLPGLAAYVRAAILALYR